VVVERLDGEAEVVLLVRAHRMRSSLGLTVTTVFDSVLRARIHPRFRRQAVAVHAATQSHPLADRIESP
jgi:hypothetical protein